MPVFLRAALRLYPRAHRQTFGAEMIDVFEQARREARARGRTARLSWYMREIIGLAADVVRAWLTAAPHPEPWIWSLEAPAIAVAMYALGVTAAHEFGLWGFFYPATYVATLGVIVAAAWFAGRTCTLRRPRRSARALAAGVLLSLFLVPASIRALEDARSAKLLRTGATTSFVMPGMQVTTLPGASQPRHVPGLTFSRTFADETGAITLVHHRDSTAPPYLALGALLAGFTAFVSRRRASW
jgi:hypothetical protein